VGCPGRTATLTIVEPVDGAGTTIATDTNPTLTGVQTIVRLASCRRRGW
jgi:hypothetical protein